MMSYQKNIKPFGLRLKALSVYNERYFKTKIRTYGTQENNVIS